MKSQTTERFRALFAAAPGAVRAKIKLAYELWTENPYHPSLRFKKVHATLPIYSARVDLNWRVVGVVKDDAVVWFWVGSHNDYERLLKSL